MNRDRLAEAMRRLKGPGARASEAKVEVRPGTTFEAVLEERLKGLEQQVSEVRGRVNGLIFLVVGAVVVEVVLRTLR